MRILMTLLIALMGSTAMATSFGQPVALKDGETHLMPTYGQTSLEYVAPVCAPEMRCAPNTKVNFAYTAGGCLDRVEHFYTVEQNPENMGVTIFVAAFNITNEESMRVRCIAMPISLKSIILPYYLSEEQVEVKFVGLVPQQ